MSVNLKKNEKALQDAYNDVVNDKTGTKWAVFGYEGNSNDLKVVETGDGDLEEMTEELSGGKVMYAFIQVTDPNTQLPKNVLVNWTGEGVPPKLKGAYARHTPDVARFLRGAHVTINARSEMDLDEDEVMKKVSTASGAKFSVHKEKARAMPAVAPVGSVYQKANPTINTSARDEFWNKAEREEESRRKDDKLTAAQQRKKEEEERRERERQEGTQRERATQERGRRIDEQKQQESAARRREREEQETQMQARLKQRETEIDSERQQEQRERQQRSNIGATDVKGKKSVFEQKAAEQSRPPVKPPPKRTVRAPPVARREPSTPPKEQTPPPREASPPPVQREPSPPPVVRREPSPPPVVRREPSPPPVVQREPSPPPVVRREPTPPSREPTPQEDEWGEPEQPMYDDVEGAQAQSTGNDYPPEPEQPLYDDVEQPAEPEEDYYSTADQPPQEEGYYPSTDQQAGDEYPPEPEQELYDDVQQPAEPEQELYDDVQQPAEPEQDLYDDVQGAIGSGLTAKTIYDYEADDDTEISFDVDEIITDIEQIDEGWWRGTRQLDGSFGLFPANYVELV